MNQVAQERGRPIDGLEHLIGDSPIITVTMAGVNLKCLVDTGSQVTLVNKSFYLAHLQPRGHKLTTVRNWLTIRVADGLELPYIGYFETDIVLAGTTVVGRDSIPVRRPDSQSREPVFKSHCGRFEPLASLITPRCHSSLSCINEYLAIQTVVDM